MRNITKRDQEKEPGYNWRETQQRKPTGGSERDPPGNDEGFGFRNLDERERERDNAAPVFFFIQHLLSSLVPFQDCFLFFGDNENFQASLFSIRSITILDVRAN